jgi:hypothetical protein
MTGRRELKQWIGPAEAIALRMRLRPVLRRDEHAGPDGTYRVRSLYFDNYQDKVLREKLDGICDRDKYRLRVYGDGMDRIRLEKKSRRDGFGWKRSTWISRAECEALLVGDTAWMKARAGEDALLEEFRLQLLASLLRPRTIVEYRREAFVHPAGNVRITIDSQLRTGLASTDFLNPDLPLLPALEPGQSVLEVKFDQYLPAFIQDLVQLGDTQSSAVSKYALCRASGDL